MSTNASSGIIPPQIANAAQGTRGLQIPQMSRLELRIKSIIFRFFQTIGRLCDNYLSTPLPVSSSLTINIPSTVSKVPGEIPLLFYTPKSYRLQRQPKSSHTQNSQTPLLPRKKYPILINIHGGGYTIGHPADDARWATEVVNSPNETPPVVISIGYRLAPEHPFPTGIEDCVSAILWVWSHADEYDLDISKTTLSGFSAGGQFCFTVLYRLHFELQVLMKHPGLLNDQRLGKVISLVAFYPPTEWTKTRAQRAASNPNFTAMIPPFLQGVMEQSYLYPTPSDMSDPLLSPGLAPDELLKVALPDQLVIITCWGDGLLSEAEAFRQRLKELEKRVDGYTVYGAPHGWDKWPSWWKGNPSRDEAYAKAAGWLSEHLESS